MQIKSNKKKRVQANLDKNLVEQAEQVFDDVGLNTTTAITAFYKQVVAMDGIPFELTRISPSERLERVIKREIDSGKFKKIESKQMLEQWLNDDES